MALTEKERADLDSLFAKMVAFFGYHPELLGGNLFSELLGDAPSAIGIGSAAIDAGALVKVSGVSTYATLGAGDDPSLMVGVAVTACAGSGQSFAVQLVAGAITTMLSDGTGTIANGASVCPSTTVAGRVKAGTTNSVGVNLGSAVAATLNAHVSVL